ncbi:RNA-directed DNA polymerase, eukaryota, reverse transcriptase zinc-binding domain protein [Tanacetum coccineum]
MTNNLVSHANKGRALDDLNTLSSQLGNVKFSSYGSDKWSWSYDSSGSFEVKILSKVLENNLLGDNGLSFHHKWNNWIPRKVNVMVWKASFNRLATRPNLIARGVGLSSSMCPLCDAETENIKHILVKCHPVGMLWKKIWSWWGLPAPIGIPPLSNAEVACENLNVHGCYKIV